VKKNQRFPLFSASAARSSGYRRAANWSKLPAATALLLLVTLSLCHAVQSVTLAWDRNSEPDIATYKLYYGTQSGNPSQSLDVGNVTTAAIANLSDGTTYFFTVTAINTAGLESEPSNEVSYTAPTSVPSPTPLPSPTPTPAPQTKSTLTVINGSGSGTYNVGQTIGVKASKAPRGKIFNMWIGDKEILNNFLNARTTATIPSTNVSIEATYKDK
jgi:hypothetical protein